MATSTLRHLRALPHDGADDVRLRDGLCRGEEAAARAFVERFQRDVNRLVWVVLGGDREHDDLVQETFEALFRGVHAVRSDAALPAWVRAVTVNTLRAALRRRRWLRLFAPVDDGLGVADETVADEARREEARRVWRALGTLGADERLLLVLREVEGYELTECAEATGCSLATVKRRLARATARLRRAMEGQLP